MTPSDNESRVEELLAHESWMRRIAWEVLRDDADVDDVIQETWLAVTPDRSTTRHTRGRLGVIVRNLAVTLLRRRVKRREVERARARSDLPANVAEAAETVDLYRTLLSWMLELPEHYRTVLLLRYANDLSPAEIAEAVGAPESTVRVRTKRGLALLRERLDREHGPARRLGWILILFGAPSTWRRALRRAAVAGVACAVVTAIAWTETGAGRAAPAHALGEFAAAPDGGRSVSRAPGGARAEARRGEPPGLEVAGPAITGSIEIGGMDVRGLDVSIEGEPFMVGEAMRFPALTPRRPRDDGGFAAVSEARVASGLSFRLGVPRTGRYRLRLGVPGLDGALFYWAETGVTVRARIDLLAELCVRVSGPRCPDRVGIGWSGRDGPRRLTARVVDGVARFEGPLVPGLDVAMTHPADGRTWRTKAHSSPCRLRLPKLAPPRSIRVLDLADGTPIAGHSAFLVHWSHDVRAWRVELETGAESVAWRRPVGGDLSRSYVELAAPGHRARRFPVDAVPTTVRLARTRDVETCVLDETGAPVAGADVFFAAADLAVWRGRTAADGCVVATETGAHLPPDVRPETAFVYGPGGLRARVDVRGGVPAILEVGEVRDHVLEVVDELDGAVGGARLMIVPVSRSAVVQLAETTDVSTDPGGRMTVPRLAGGPWLAYVLGPRGEETSVALDAFSEARHVVRLPPAGNRDALVFRVRDGDGRPVPHVRVRVRVGGGTPPLVRITDRDGAARFPALSPADGLPFWAIGEAMEAALATPSETSTDGPMEVTMREIARFEVSEPAPAGTRGWVAASSGGSRRRIAPLEASGRAALTREPQTLRIARPGLGTAALRFDPSAPPPPAVLPPGTTVVLEDLAPKATVALTALEIESMPGLPECALRAFDVSPAVTDGSASVALTPGVYRIAAGRTAARLVVGDEDLTLAIRDLDRIPADAMKRGGGPVRRPDRREREHRRTK